MQALRFFDPGDDRFVGRMLRVGLVGILVLGCLAVAVAASVSSNERARYAALFVLTEMDMNRLALPLSESLVREHPASEWAYYRLKAVNLRRLGRIGDSLAVYDDAVRSLPDSWWAHSHRCFYNALLADAAPVMDSCDRQLQLSPDEMDVALDRRGIARGLTGDRSGAIADFEAALPLMDPDGAEGWRIPVREQWLRSLHAGDDPFTAEALSSELAHY
jgi:tetratricopeptide (TPR) repeat protein